MRLKIRNLQHQTALINVLIGNENIALRCCDVTVSLDFDTEATRNLNNQYINLQQEVKATRLHLTWDSRITAKATMIILVGNLLITIEGSTFN